MIALTRALFLCAAAASAATPPGLNHFAVILDHDTYDAIEKSAPLKEQFAAFEKRTTVRTDRTYSGIYLYGDQSYIEFLERSPGVTGNALLAFGGDAPTANTSGTLTTREFNGAQVPWFFNLSQPWKAGEGFGLGAFLLEYHSAFLAQWHSEAKPFATPSTRTAVLERYRAVLPSVPEHPLFGLVTQITIAARPELQTRLEAWLKTIGADFPIKFVAPGSGREGIRAVEFRLNRAPEKDETLRFSLHSTLVVRKDRSAEWTFE